MHSAHIRKRFLKYFEQQGHTVVNSSPVVPHADPTLLFCNAGMNQFKEAFLGQATLPYRRATTSQKCIRAGGKHNDLENVGHTSRHLTFFEMLGNFSFGDYFKKEAIDFSWHVATQIFEFDPNLIWPTVFREDDEAFELWTRYVSADRITRMDEKDNFWAMGDTGPCGPCSELYFDRGPSFSQARHPGEDSSGERYLEFWNLVFMQYNRQLDGSLEKLARQSIDTGSGLERVMSLKMGVSTLFETDILQSLIQEIARLSGRPYDSTAPSAASYRVIADHIRSLAFAIADGAQPSNVERGYVLRKILRRAVRYGKNLNFEGPFLAKLLPTLNESMGQDYPEITQHMGRMEEILTLEEESFLRTLKRGGRLLEGVCIAAKEEKRSIRGEEAFNLKDTYGLPLEEIQLLAHDEGLSIDQERFLELEAQARELSRSSQKKTHQIASKESLDGSVGDLSTQFVGYESSQSRCKLLAIMIEGQKIDQLSEEQEAALILDTTPFYAEKGGQLADQGVLSAEGIAFEVSDVQPLSNQLVIHRGKLLKGSLQLGQLLVAQIDTSRRQSLARAHTATHLLHWALIQVLGEHIQQKGSLVDVDALRFDFSHHKPVTAEQIAQIERLVNQKILLDVTVSSVEKRFSEVAGEGAIKQFFAEKYGEFVRLVDIDFSKELCGGTHVRSTSQIGLFRLNKESGIAAGCRRIEAEVGEKALFSSESERQILAQMSAQFKCLPLQLPQRIEALHKEYEELKRIHSESKKRALQQLAQKLMSSSSHVGSIEYLEVIDQIAIEDLPGLSEQLISFPGISLLCAKSSERVQIIVRSGSAAQERGLQAGKLIQELAHWIDGKGGGRPDCAQAGGKCLDNIQEMIADLRHKLTSHVSSTTTP